MRQTDRHTQVSFIRGTSMTPEAMQSFFSCSIWQQNPFFSPSLSPSTRPLRLSVGRVHWATFCARPRPGVMEEGEERGGFFFARQIRTLWGGKRGWSFKVKGREREEGVVVVVYDVGRAKAVRQSRYRQAAIQAKADNYLAVPFFLAHTFYYCYYYNNYFCTRAIPCVCVARKKWEGRRTTTIIRGGIDKRRLLTNGRQRGNLVLDRQRLNDMIKK